MHAETPATQRLQQQPLVAIIADTESSERRRTCIVRGGIPPEHPRACTTDNAECFFSVLRDEVGKDFTLKEICKSKTLWMM